MGTSWAWSRWRARRGRRRAAACRAWFASPTARSERLEANARRAAEALALGARWCARAIHVKMFRAEVYQNGKATFYFASEKRIDFRDLVRDLGNKLRPRVELRQIGVRDEAKMVGGIGSCGLELCCTTCLPGFVPVSIKMAKDQGLVLNPTKVSGQCGRLKCCLVYEQASYVEAAKALPKLGKRVSTPAGEGRVVELDVLRRRVRVYFQDGPPQVFTAEQVKELGPPPGSGPVQRRARPRRRAAARRARVTSALAPAKRNRLCCRACHGSVLRHDAHLLRKRPAPPRHVLLDGGGRRDGALPPRARRATRSS